MKNLYITLGIVFAFVIGGLIGYVSHQSHALGATNNAAGTTFNTAKVAQVNITPSTGSATSSSILNSDATDRYITNSYVACNTVGTSLTAYTGAGLTSAGWLWRMATTAAAITGALADSNTNYASNAPLSTSTAVSFIASSTEGVLTGNSRIWPTGTYLTIQPNATNTAVCTAGVYYISS